MNEDFVTYEQAVQLKELGFDWECFKIWCCKTARINRMLPKDDRVKNKIKRIVERHPIYSLLDNDGYFNYETKAFQTTYTYREISYCPAPTLAQAQKWLREIHKLDCNANCDPYSLKWFWYVFSTVKSCEGILDDENMFDTYEAALLSGIDKAIELLK